jgi:MFS transporter, SP family, sugar:H+ symporter
MRDEGTWVEPSADSTSRERLTLIEISQVDKMGRNPLLIIGSVGMTVTLGVVARIFGTADLDVDGNPNLFVFFLGMSSAVVWAMLGEKFPNRTGRGSVS